MESYWKRVFGLREVLVWVSIQYQQEHWSLRIELWSSTVYLTTLVKRIRWLGLERAIVVFFSLFLMFKKVPTCINSTPCILSVYTQIYRAIQQVITTCMYIPSYMFSTYLPLFQKAMVNINTAFLYYFLLYFKL